MIRAAITGAALLALAGCGVVYTAPDVNEGQPFGTAHGTDFDVRVIRLTHETAEAANLEPYVPPRLPAAFQPGAVVSMAEVDIALPSLPPLPRHTARALSRPDIRRGELPPPVETEPYRIGVADGLLLTVGQPATVVELGDLPPLPEHSAQPVSRPEVRRGELPPPTEPQPYRVGVGDVLVLALRDVASLEELPGLITAQSRRQGYVVQDDGAIGIPDAGRVRVAGLTLQEAESAIFDALVAAGIEPAFSLEINEFNSKHVAVGGLVGSPTVIPITLQPLRLDEAIQVAGGLTAEDPATSTVQLLRDGTIYEITVERYIEEPEARNIRLQDGDSVFVGTEYREGEARRYFEEQLSLRSQQLQSAQLQLQLEQLRKTGPGESRLHIVQDDGTVSVLDAGRVPVVGLTAQEAEAKISEALEAAGIDPKLSLQISEFNSRRVSVGGLVGAPAVVPITLDPLQLDEAIQRAGGIATDDPGVTTIQIFRDGVTYQVPLERYIGDPAARNVVLQDGDSVFVGTQYREAEAQRYFQEQLQLRQEAVRTTDFQIRIEQLRQQRESRAQQRLADERAVFKDRLELGAVNRPYAYRAGEVAVPGRFPLPFEGTASLADGLLAERGLNIQTANYAEIYVLRGAADPERFGSLTAYHLDAENAVNLAVASQFELRPNDVIFVSEQPITSWNRVVSQILPQLFLQFGRTLSAAAN